jgi:hypothetical protein
MVDSGVRRLYVRGLDKVVSDSSIVRGMYPMLMHELRDDPDKLLRRRLVELPGLLEKPGVVTRADDANQAMGKLLAVESRCLMPNPRDSILTPWDLTVKLWKRLAP